MRARGCSSAVMLCAYGAQSLRRHLAGLVAFVGRAGLKTSMSHLSSDARTDHHAMGSEACWGQTMREPAHEAFNNTMCKNVTGDRDAGSPEWLPIYQQGYNSVESAKADLDALEQLHEDDVVGKFDAAVVDNENGKSHIIKRMDRPRVRVIPEELGFGPLSRKELKEAAAELSGSEAALIMVVEPTLQKAFDKAVTRAAKTVKQTVDMTTDELARELKSAVGS